jgi:hypothetical protein
MQAHILRLGMPTTGKLPDLWCMYKAFTATLAIYQVPAAGPPRSASAFLSVTFASCCLASTDERRLTRSARVASLPACLAAAAAAAPVGGEVEEGQQM